MFIWKTCVSRVNVALKKKLLEVPVLFLAPFRACSLCRPWFLSALLLVLLMPLGSQIAADSLKLGYFHYGWVALLESSSPPRPWLDAGFVTWVSSHGDDMAGSTRSLQERSTNAKERSLLQHPTFRQPQLQLSFCLLVYIKSNWLLI